MSFFRYCYHMGVRTTGHLSPLASPMLPFSSLSPTLILLYLASSGRGLAAQAPARQALATGQGALTTASVSPSWGELLRLGDMSFFSHILLPIACLFLFHRACSTLEEHVSEKQNFNIVVGILPPHPDASLILQTLTLYVAKVSFLCFNIYVSILQRLFDGRRAFFYFAHVSIFFFELHRCLLFEQGFK